MSTPAPQESDNLHNKDRRFSLKVVAAVLWRKQTKANGHQVTETTNNLFNLMWRYGWPENKKETIS